MPSPFPGVDPYIESQHYWQDFHANFIVTLSQTINDALPPQYEARIEEQVEILELDPETRHLVRPDVTLLRPPSIARITPAAEPPQGNLALAESIIMAFPSTEEVRERWLNILHRPERSVVAVIELLSPTNKTNPGRGHYLVKRSRLFTQEIHLVELDFLLAGQRLPMAQPLPPADHYAIIARSDRRPNADVYAWNLPDNLPAIPIPLLKPDRDVHVDLTAAFTLAFDRGRYARSLNYAATLEVPLNPETQTWAQNLAQQSTH